MTWALVLFVCVSGSCNQWKPEGHEPVFRSLQDCREARTAIVRRILSMGAHVGANGLCALAEPEQVAEGE